MTMPAHQGASSRPASELAEFRHRLEEARQFHASRLEDVDRLGSDDISMAMIRRTEASLEAVDAALERIEAGTFGVCVSCHGRIAAERLEALPHADVCARCVGAAR